MGLCQGSEILITRPTLTSLLISVDAVAPTSAQHEAIIEVGEKEATESLFRKIVSLYVLGYNQISVRGTNGFLSTTKRDSINESVRRHLIGTEGVSDSRDKITIHVLLGYSELSVESAIKKMLLISSSLRKEAMTALEMGDRQLAEAVIQREDEVGRFGLYVIRQLNMSLSQGVSKDSALEPRDVLGYTLVAKALERIAYHSSRPARVVLEANKQLQKSALSGVAQMSETTSRLVEDALLSLFKRDHAGADAVVEAVKRLEDAIRVSQKAMQEKDVNESYVIHVLMESQGRIAEYARNIAETVLDLTVERIIRKEEAAYLRAT